MVAAAASGKGPHALSRVRAVGHFLLAAVLVAAAAAPWTQVLSEARGSGTAFGLVLASAVLLAVPGVPGAVLTALLRGRPRVLGVLALLALVLALVGIEAACVALNGMRGMTLDFNELYTDFGATAEAAFLVLALGAALSLLPVRMARVLANVGIMACGVCLLLSPVLLADYGSKVQDLPRALIDSDDLTTVVHGALVSAFDGDNDGASRLGGVDCDDADAAVNPMQPERPGNGKDDNCLLGDGVLGEPPRFEAQPLQAPVKRVIVFLWDALRADHLALYGYGRETAPNLSAFAQDAVVFRHVSSSGGMTRSFYAGFSSGSYQAPPAEPGQGFFSLRDKRFATVKKPEVSFLTALGDAGVDRLACMLHGQAHSGFADGYTSAACPGCKVKWKRNRRATAPVMVKCAQKLVARVDKDKPTLIVVHVFDPHAIYRPHKMTPPEWGRGRTASYDGEILYADAHVQKVLQLFAEAGLTDDAAILMTSDHGEGLFEHGRSHHGHTAYDEMNRVPLLVRLPGQRGTQWVEQPVENGDLGATIRDLLAVDLPLPMTGASLVPLLSDPQAPFPRAEAMGYAIRTPGSSFSLTRWPYKALWDRRLAVWELYDLNADPGETRNVAREQKAVLAPLKSELERRVELYRL